MVFFPDAGRAMGDSIGDMWIRGDSDNLNLKLYLTSLIMVFVGNFPFKKEVFLIKPKADDKYKKL